MTARYDGANPSVCRAAGALVVFTPLAIASAPDRHFGDAGVFSIEPRVVVVRLRRLPHG